MLSPAQEKIVNIDGNLIVRASAGTGKTFTLVSKIAHDIGKNHNHKVIAAITFTIKAANEIKERLTIDPDRHFIGTNNSFAIEEIIKPFMRDVYGSDFDLDMSTDYSLKFDSFDKGISQVKNNQLLGAYSDSKNNFIFQLAYDILTKSRACREYIKARYFKMYIDEYQDCDKDMHALFMYICDELKIETFAVGDEKQSIYIWRGAYPQAFLSIWEKDNFSKEFLRENYRSCTQIQNYSNALCDETCDLFYKVDNCLPVALLCTNHSEWAAKTVSLLDKNKKTALLRYSNGNAEKGADELNRYGMGFVYIPQTPISDITTNTAWLYNALASYFILPKFSVYDILQIVPEEAVGSRKVKSYVEKKLAELDECLELEDKESFFASVEKIALYFGYEVKNEHVNKLYETIQNPRYHSSFKEADLQNVSITFHSSKGLEFDQVVVFAEDYRLDKPDSVYNHYVAATRAKQKLIIVYDENNHNAKQFYTNLSNIVTKRNRKVEDYLIIYR